MQKRGGYRITFLERLEVDSTVLMSQIFVHTLKLSQKQKNDSSLSVVGRKKKPDISNVFESISSSILNSKNC